MLDIYIVIARELGEALLIIAALRLMARERPKPIATSPIVWGAVAGATAATLVMTLLVRAALDARISALITMAFSLSVLLASSSTLSSANSLYGHTEDTVQTWLQRLTRGPAVVAVAFLVAFRETMEVVVFLNTLQVSLISANALGALLLVAITFVVLIGAFRSIATRKCLLLVFHLSALLLAFVAVRLLLEGTHALLLAMAPPAWVAYLAPLFRDGDWHAGALCILMIPVLKEFIGTWLKETVNTAFERR
jgi:high-affinity iron transporter